MNKQDKLLKWMIDVGTCSSVDLYQYGLNNGYIRARRTAQNLAAEGKIRRIPDEEAIMRGLIKHGKAKIAWYDNQVAP